MCCCGAASCLCVALLLPVQGSRLTLPSSLPPPTHPPTTHLQMRMMTMSQHRAPLAATPPWWAPLALRWRAARAAAARAAARWRRLWRSPLAAAAASSPAPFSQPRRRPAASGRWRRGAAPACQWLMAALSSRGRAAGGRGPTLRGGRARSRHSWRARTWCRPTCTCARTCGSPSPAPSEPPSVVGTWREWGSAACRRACAVPALNCVSHPTASGVAAPPVVLPRGEGSALEGI